MNLLMKETKNSAFLMLPGMASGGESGDRQTPHEALHGRAAHDVQGIV